MATIRAGIASVDFTPEPGLPLMGNFRDDYAARGTHDPLCARAVVFADGHGAKVSLLAVDICMLDRHNVAFMREVIGTSCDVPPENVLIHATHTHSGPAPTGKLGLDAEVAPHRAAIDAFLRKAASAVVAANETLDDAVLEVGSASEHRLSFHRRLLRRDGTTQMNWEALQPGFQPSEILQPWGPVDPELISLTVRRERVPMAVVVNFGLHPAILAGDNWFYSADYPGCLNVALARSLGEDSQCVFLNGCCGDVNHIDYRHPSQGRGYEMAQRVGEALAATAMQALGTGTALPADCVRIAREQVELERLKISPREAQWCEQVLEQSRAHPPRGQVDGVPDAYYAKLRLQMAKEQHQPDRVEVMAMRIGDLAIVGLPGEAFCQLGLEIKRCSTAKYTMVAGLCNDAVGYLPARQSFEQGGYETTAGSTFYAPGSAERIVDSARRQLAGLFATTC